jgi:hypothetical protein
MNESALPRRSGSRPRTTPTNPHTQLEQNPQPEMVEELVRRIFALPDVEVRPSAISVPGARALWLREALSAGPREAFMIGREFAHIHPMPDGSLHAALPPEIAQEAIGKGWAEQHPVARMGYIPPNVVMIYAPRDEQEIEVVAGLVVESRAGRAQRSTPLERDRLRAKPPRVRSGRLGRSRRLHQADLPGPLHLRVHCERSSQEYLRESRGEGPQGPRQAALPQHLPPVALLVRYVTKYE